MRPIKQIIIHCSDSDFGNVNTIREWHKKPPFNFADIGYHYVITNGYTTKKSEYDPKTDGKIETGRAIERPGAHCEGNNYDSIGVCLIGINEFTPLQIESLLAIIERIRERFGKIPVVGHYEKASAKKQGKTCPNIDMVEFRKQWSLN
jgi:N-acetylmuramoyl-L-alanine amidase